MLTALIGGGLSLLSSFGAAKSAKSQARRQQAMEEEARRYNQYQVDLANSHNEALGRELLETPARRMERNGVDVDAMMLDAERAGFNPVTWLQSGALQAYGWSDVAETQPAEAFRMMMRSPLQVQAGTAANIPSALQAIGDAGKAALNIYRQDAAVEDSQNFQRELLSMRLDQVARNGGSLGGSMFGSVPRITTAGSATSSSKSPALTDRGFESDPAKMTPSVFGRSSWWQNDQRWPNADSVTGVYGEGSDWSYGPLKFGNDLMVNTTRGVGFNRGQGIGYYDVMDMATVGAGMWKDAVGAPRPWFQRALQGLDLDQVFRNPNRAQPWLGSAQ